MPLHKTLSILCLSCLCVHRAAASEPIRLERSAPAMGTVYSVTVYGESAGQMLAAAQAALEEAQRLDQMLSNYRPDSELSRVNDHAFQTPVEVSEEFFDLLTACLDYSTRSGGAFDITVGPLMKLWGFYKGSGRLPKPSEVSAALGNVGYRHVILNKETHTVRFDRQGMSLDPGGVGKGYAVDRMVGVLRQSGISSALVSAGGSSIYGLGTPPGEPRGWFVKIKNPKDQTETAADVFLRDESLSTSGNYEKFFRANGKLYSHIMNPRTGFPAQGMLAVSVVAPLTLDSEVWAKPYYILGRGWTESHKPKTFRVLLCEESMGGKCQWVK